MSVKIYKLERAYEQDIYGNTVVKELTPEQETINALIDAIEALQKRVEEHEHGQSGKPIPAERGHNANCPINTPPETGREWAEERIREFERLFCWEDNDTAETFIKAPNTIEGAVKLQKNIVIWLRTALAQGEKIGAEKERERIRKSGYPSTDSFGEGYFIPSDALKGTL